ncbi:MAG: NUDIX hydrolase [Lentisphaeria bacterium]|nr:NUDIX hydrolase [Lentisphaeria bacterium]
MSGELYAQAAAIPYRFDADGRLETLLIRKAHKKKWGIPKGLIDPGQTPEETAAKEAMEEGGVAGQLSDEPIGYFAFKKWGGICHVTVFALHVTEVHDDYPEQGRRVREWLPLTTAAETAGRKKLRKLLLKLPRAIKKTTH